MWFGLVQDLLRVCLRLDGWLVLGWFRDGLGLLHRGSGLV